MLPNRMGRALTLAAVMTIAGFSAATTAQAGGYGHGNGGSWNNHQTYTPKRHRVQRQVYNGNNQHLRWCYNQYRSFRRSDNTFQPYHGPRKECLSPYVEERLELFADRRNEAPEALFQNQAGGTIQQGGTDQFGNQPEFIENGTVQVNGNATQSDAFGNLPERVSAVSGETAPANPEQPAAVAATPEAPVAQESGATGQAPADSTANNALSEPALSVGGGGAQNSAEPAAAAGSQAGEEARAVAAPPAPAPVSTAEPAVQSEADKGVAQAD